MFRGIHDFVQEVERPQQLERRTRALGRPGALITDRLLARLQRAEARMAERVRRLFRDHDLLLTPVMAQPAVPAGIMEGRGATVTYLGETTWVPFNVLWNSTGRPAASIPAGLSPTGLPARRPADRPAARRDHAAVSRRAARAGATLGAPPTGAVLRRRPRGPTVAARRLATPASSAENELVGHGILLSHRYVRVADGRFGYLRGSDPKE